MKKIIATIAMFVVVFMGLMAPATAGNGQDKVDVCHRTASESNPYVFISVPQDEADGHITGTGKQHNHKVFWDTAGVWDGFSHNAGDERVDYYAAGGLSKNCTNGDEQPPVETPVNPVDFTVNAPDCDTDGSLVIPDQPEGVNVDPAPGTYGPGEYEVTYTADKGFVLTDDPSDTVVVREKTGDCPSTPIVVTPVLPTVAPADCDTDGQLLIPEQPTGVVATYHFEDPTFPDDYTGPGDYAVVFTTLDGYVFPPNTQTAYLIGVDAAFGNCPNPPCVTDCGPGHPDKHHHGTPPEHHTTVTQKHVEVPTVVESGLATLDKAESATQTSDPTGLFVLIGVALLGLGYVALRRSKQ
jgi:hypothetical protein